MTTIDTSSTRGSAFRAPSGWVSVALAAAAIALLAGYMVTGPHEPNIVVEHGVAREDETAAARIWQILMLLQLPTLAVFAVRWLPKDPQRAVAMLAIQGLAFMAAALPVALLGL